MKTDLASRFELEIDRHWLRWTWVVWVVAVVWLVTTRWAAIHWLALSDTDDNMRLMQVRGLLSGQGWYDLRQYRLNPPGGFDIHWSRLVDLPIAALILAFKPFVGTPWAERLACGIAPLIPLGVAMSGIAFTVRRLVAPAAWALAFIILFGASVTMLMFMPMRIDHHGWQLAMLSLTVAGLADPRRARGGLLVGGASALSLTIGLELLPYAAMAGAIVTLRWIWDRDEARRLTVYALALGGGCAAGFAAFGSYDNLAIRCDALTPVWLSVMAVAGALLLVLALVNPERARLRFALATAAGTAIVAGFAALYPQCLSRPEGVSDELARTWLNNVREAKPIYGHPFRLAFPIAALPVAGLIGASIATWRARGSDRFTGWAAVALFIAFAVAMLFWQVRSGPAAQLLGVIGATALAWIIVPWCLKHRWLAVRVGGSVSAFLIVSGLFAGLIIPYLPIEQPTTRTRTINRASGRCASVIAMQTLDRFPATTMFTHVDLGPRLIVTTHHSAVGGPYHRNGDAILDIHQAFTGSPANFLATARRHGATMLLTCPNLAETTVYRARAKFGFYGQLVRGRVPAFLVPVKLPRGTPYRLWRIDYRAGTRPPATPIAVGAE